MTEVNQFRHPVKSYKESGAKILEWIEVYWIPMPIWRTYQRLRHPRRHFNDWRRWRKRPKIGGFVMYHDEGPYRVLARDGDELTIEMDYGPAVVSWMSCCDPVEKS